MDYVEFGKYLSQQRELRGLSRDEVSRVTKISPSLLAALEEGQ
ncbi:MAG: helix-turn-helix domain-containing protein, partial [Cystobacter sp.]